MKADSADRIEAILYQAVEIESADQRAQFLDEACAGDAFLRASVEQMIHNHFAAGNFLQHPAIGATQVFEETAGASENNHATRPAEDIPLEFLEPAEQPGSLGRLGRYEILEVIGRGGMGIVLKARDTNLQRIVAVKVLAPELAANATARKRFLREAQAAAAVSHNHVVTIHAVEENGGVANGATAKQGHLPFLVMEFIDGQSLQEKIDRQGALELKEIFQIGRQIASGLAAAHRQGLIHRDIKPANILLQNGVQRVQITDFGLARAVDDVGMTRTGEVTGTPVYMSPEQAMGQPVDGRSDLFSLGSVLYAMCTGRAPFRAETTIAVLRRVCDETPRPIQEVAPEIPAWLAALISRLLEKHPDQRFQSATEVGDLLRKHLAHVQAPHTSPLPDTVLAAEHPAKSRSRQKAWLRVLLVLLVLVSGFGVTEATGVTNFSATVVRVLTPDGTLVIETDDPGVKVSIEGDGGIVITGAGPQEVRLKPGSYRVHAAKDGKSVRDELITITRGGRRTVRVTHEKPAAPVVIAPAAIREIWHRPLPGYVNDIALSADGLRAVACSGKLAFLFDPASGQMLQTMEGHEDPVRSVAFSPDGRSVASGGHDATVRIWDPATGREIRRFATERIVDGGSGRPFSNLAFSPDGTHLLAGSRNDLLMWNLESGDLIQRFVGHTNAPRRVTFSPDGKLVASGAHDGTARIWRTETGELIRTLREGSHWITEVDFSPDGKFLATGGRIITLWDVESGRERWRFPIGRKMAEGMAFTPDGRILLAGISFSTPEAGELVVLDVLTGREVDRAGGLSEMVYDIESAADSRGVFIGEKEGIRLWRLPESVGSTERPSSTADSATPGAFAVLGGKGAPERKFDTLAEAVQHSSDGATIEIRGNGPFVSDGVTIGHPLVIRAGEGYTPSLVLSKTSANRNIPLLNNAASLVLEGLELRRIGGAVVKVEDRLPKLIDSWHGEGLHIANCRLILNTGIHRIGEMIGGKAALFALKNCELSGDTAYAASWRYASNGRFHVENCVSATGMIGFHQDDPDAANVVIRVRQNTLVGGCMSLVLWSKPNLGDNADAAPPIRLDFSRNVARSDPSLRNRGTLFLHQSKLDQPYSVAEAEALLPRLVRLAEEQNVYLSGTHMLQLAVDWKHLEGTRGQNLADWNRFWMQKNTDSAEGDIRFHGGNLILRAATADESLVAQDFRLRPDSAGYRAGPDGKDLGADVDLVGPGAAYERWKKTPEYQEWLKETGQAKSVNKSGR